MRAKVLKLYQDRFKKTRHNEGDTVTLTAERLAELEAAGFVKAIPDTPGKKTKPGADRITKEEKATPDTK